MAEINKESIAIVGLSKNAGKTTLLNALIGQWSRRLVLGLFSIGVDGEERDVWSGRAKPQIEVPAGTVIATASRLIDRQPGHYQVVGNSGIDSTLGEVFIARTVRATRVKLAGISKASEAKRILELLYQSGAERVLIDGAYDRKANANPFIADRVWIVVGASLGPSLAGVAQKAEEWFHVLRLPACPPEAQIIWSHVRETGQMWGKRASGWEGLPHSSLLGLTGHIEPLRQQEWETLLLPGALTDRMLQAFIAGAWAPDLVLPDSTHVLARLPALRRFYELGGTVRVFRPIEVAGVAVNPESPEGYSFDPLAFKQTVAKLCAPVPVWDVVRDPMPKGGSEDEMG